MYQRILVPIDGSATASRGLDEAIALAKLTGGSLHLLHCVDDLSVATGYGGYTVYSADVLTMLRAAGTQLLNDAKARALTAGVQAETALRDSFAGRVSDLVVEHAEAWPADLIVVGTHGRRGFARLVMGSDAEQIMRTSPVPVLLVRPADAPSSASARTVAGVSARVGTSTGTGTATPSPIAETVAA